MAVVLTISETLGGGAISDALAGGGTGVDVGPVTNNSYAPLTDKINNQGEQDIFVSHDGVASITDAGIFLQTFGVGTGFSYGGADSAAADYAQLIAYGNASGSSKNNGDGLSGGLWVDMDWDSNDTTRFDQANFPAVVKIFGDAGTDGIDLASAFTLATAGMVYDSGGETSASAPVAGEIGPSGSTTLGDNAHSKYRIYLPQAASAGGIIQWEVVYRYSFTA